MITPRVYDYTVDVTELWTGYRAGFVTLQDLYAGVADVLLAHAEVSQLPGLGPIVQGLQLAHDTWEEYRPIKATLARWCAAVKVRITS